ncbi:thymidine kinase, cytosolic-like isoform X2 [Rhodnius prolixus]|uniref:thymidine kinase, cytosolic-like isoform X2 n=1 Tax=Rhodnius prolixus TaxID=13249 RepID=UPI003D18EB26
MFCCFIPLIVGPMFSGKTSELMKRIKRFKLVGFRCLIIKFAKDIRYSEENLASHDGKEMPAIATLKLMELSNVTVTCDVIGIDEAQFFPDTIPFCQEQLERGKIIVAAGLDATFRRTGFDDVLNLIPLAHSVDKLSAICMSCGGNAAFSKRVGTETEVVVIGGLDKYMAVCRECYKLDCPPKSSPFQEMHAKSCLKLPECDLIKLKNSFPQEVLKCSDSKDSSSKL